MQRCKNIFKWLLIILGCQQMAMVLLAFTSLPYFAYTQLATNLLAKKFYPHYIIFMGGSGMPSGDNLMRLYETTTQAKRFINATVVLVHPDSGKVMEAMVDVLLNNQINENRILKFAMGTNTVTQVQSLSATHPEWLQQNVLFITSPECVKRTLYTLNKAGFKNIDAMPAFENAMYSTLTYEHKAAGGSTWLPDVSGRLDVRYNFWNYYKLQITCLREYVALLYYKLNGWI